jgi:SAM-dependent methyltransferase
MAIRKSVVAGLGLILVGISAGVHSSGAQGQAPAGQSLAPFVPTPQDVVDRMLVLAEVTSKDVVYDLGCGDGRIPITAAKKYGARGVGVDIDPQRIAESRTNAKKAGVENRVEFLLQDAMTVDVSSATVVTLYLSASSNLALRPILTRQLKPGARIVSHVFGMGDWSPLKVDEFRDSTGVVDTLYMWKADGRMRP